MKKAPVRRPYRLLSLNLHLWIHRPFQKKAYLGVAEYQGATRWMGHGAVKSRDLKQFDLQQRIRDLRNYEEGRMIWHTIYRAYKPEDKY